MGILTAVVVVAIFLLGLFVLGAIADSRNPEHPDAQEWPE